MKIFKSFSILLILFATIDVLAQQQKVTIEDLMRFRNISNSSISDKGKWVSYDVWPDRGDGEAVFVSSDGKKCTVWAEGEAPKSILWKHTVRHL